MDYGWGVNGGVKNELTFKIVHNGRGISLSRIIRKVIKKFQDSNLKLSFNGKLIKILPYYNIIQHKYNNNNDIRKKNIKIVIKNSYKIKKVVKAQLSMGTGNGDIAAEQYENEYNKKVHHRKSDESLLITVIFLEILKEYGIFYLSWRPGIWEFGLRGLRTIMILLTLTFGENFNDFDGDTNHNSNRKTRVRIHLASKNQKKNISLIWVTVNKDTKNQIVHRNIMFITCEVLVRISKRACDRLRLRKEWYKHKESLTSSLKLLFLFCSFLLLMIILFTILIIEIPIGKTGLNGMSDKGVARAADGIRVHSVVCVSRQSKRNRSMPSQVYGDAPSG
ncbi:hypothetical protein AGLY_015794 [Aphis glycines]|uniref:Uncharacterized protein n=1 Tax=Aphis glycines TaxID=307491 RepID=A0A6G0SZU3_APHGL|nr:hypothetical protein AGLY_015794 [Aphis glycines]